MSLINDALKKAKQAQVNAPGRESRPQLRSPETDHPVRSGPSLMLPAIIVAVGLIGAALVWVAMTNKHDEKKAEPLGAENPTASAKTEPAVALKVEQRVPAPVAPVAPPQPVVTAAATVVETKPTTVTPALLKLNGIFYNPAKPTAIVNNKLVSPGSRIGEFTVIAITQTGVSIAGGGQTNVLSLSE